MTFSEARAICKADGMTIRKNINGEYRVNFIGGHEDTAYYTDDRDDAVNTARHMAARERSIKSMIAEVISKTRR